MKGEFLIQVNVAFGANSGLELSQETFTRIVTFSSRKPKKCIHCFMASFFEGWEEFLHAVVRYHTPGLKVNIGLNHIHLHDK